MKGYRSKFLLKINLDYLSSGISYGFEASSSRLIEGPFSGSKFERISKIFLF